jgi:polysaccharide biosynthesis transport protein
VGLSNRINQSRVAEVRALYEQQRQKVMKMRDGRDQGSVLYREVDNAQKQYDAILARQTQTQLESRDTLSNVSVLNLANEPLTPSSPKSLLNMVAAVFLGGLLGVGAAVLLEFANRKVRSIDDVVQSLGLPVLGVLPPPDRRGARAQPTSLLARQVLGQLPAPAPKRA